MSITLALPAAAITPEEAIRVVAINIRPSPFGRDLAEVEVVTRNLSLKTITAWHMEGIAEYADGHTEKRAIGADQIFYQFAPQFQQAWKPGQTRSDAMTVPVGPSGDLPVRASCRIGAVVFDDDTAVGEKRLIQLIAAGRANLARQGLQAVAAVEKALKSPDPANALRQYLQEKKITPQNGYYPGMEGNVYHLLVAGAPRETIDAYLAMMRESFLFLEAHASLREEQ